MHILLVEDNPDHAELITDSCLAAFGSSAQIVLCPTAKKALSELEQSDSAKIDIALFDLKLPDSDINATVKTLGILRTDIPIVVLTSLNDTVLSLGLINQGIQDYLPKEDLSPALLERVCRYAIERKKQQLKLESRAQAQQIFCESLSHDFKSPIRNLGQLVTLLQASFEKRGVINEKERNLFALMDNRLNSMTDLVGGLYQYLQVDSYAQELDVVDLDEVIDRVLIDSDFYDSEKVALVRQPLLKVRGNLMQLYLLFMNLFENAIKYCERYPEINVYGEADGQGYNVYLQDNGIGMEGSELKGIFQPFTRIQAESKPGGGLGLAIASRVAENCDGNISVTSTPGEGSCFCINLCPAY